MHYGDPNHLKEAVLELIIYKHVDLSVGCIEEMFDYQICSIYNAKCIDVYHITEVWEEFEKRYPKQLKCLEAECFYLVTFKYELKKKNWILVWTKETKITEQMVKKNPLIGLH